MTDYRHHFPFTGEDFLKTEDIDIDRVISTRYPFTYACDFIRSHTEHVCKVLEIEYTDEMVFLSRAGASGFMKKLNGGDSDYRHIAEVFADAYIIEHNLVW